MLLWRLNGHQRGHVHELRCFRCMIRMCESEGGVWFWQVFNDAIEALRVSYRKMNPFCVPFATTNMGSAMLAMDLVRLCAG